jgi:hypothetical protein
MRERWPAIKENAALLDAANGMQASKLAKQVLPLPKDLTPRDLQELAEDFDARVKAFRQALEVRDPMQSLQAWNTVFQGCVGCHMEQGIKGQKLQEKCTALITSVEARSTAHDDEELQRRLFLPRHLGGGCVLENFPGGAAQGVPPPGRAVRAHDDEVGVAVERRLGDAFGGQSVLYHEVHRHCCRAHVRGMHVLKVLPTAFLASLIKYGDLEFRRRKL